MIRNKYCFYIISVTVFFAFGSKAVTAKDHSILSSILLKIIEKTSSLDLYPLKDNKTGKVISSHDPLKRWLFEKISDLVNINPLNTINRIQIVRLKKRSPFMDNNRKYYPGVTIEEWTCTTEQEAENVKVFFSQCMDKDEIRYIYFKNPVLWIQHKNSIYYLSTGAHIYKKYLEKVSKILSSILAEKH